jgi:hypothetical protein
MITIITAITAETMGMFILKITVAATSEGARKIQQSAPWPETMEREAAAGGLREMMIFVQDMPSAHPRQLILR